MRSITSIGGFILNNEIVVPKDFTISQISDFLNTLSLDNKEWWDGYYNETSKMMQAEWIFRGNADSRWELIPSALRTGTVLCKHPAKCAPLNNNHEQISAEFQLIKNFRLLLDEGGLPIPEDSQLFRTAMTEL